MQGKIYSALSSLARQLFLGQYCGSTSSDLCKMLPEIVRKRGSENDDCPVNVNQKSLNCRQLKGSKDFHSRIKIKV